jgi:UDPglucose 6-dehydrogenase
MKVAVIGTGYVGLVSGVGFTHLSRHTVSCVDTRDDVVERINRAEPTLYEQGLEALLGEVVAEGLLTATTDYAVALEGASVALICVGTPSAADGSINLDYIRQASRSIGEQLRQRDDFVVVAVKSTVVPGTTETVVIPEIEAASGKTAGVDFGVGMTPEFLREGVALHDFLHPDRVVIGSLDARSDALLRELYGAHDAPVLSVSPRSAELIKYVSNAYLALHISFANEVALLAEQLGGVDVRDVLEGVYLDHRHTPRLASGDELHILRPEILGYLVPNCGYGGSCLPKDVSALAHWAADHGLPPALLQATHDVNHRMPLHLVDRLERELGGLKGKTIAALGLAFKFGTDDVRESPTLQIVPELVRRGATVRACDPLELAHANFRREVGELPGLSYHVDTAEALSGADAAALLIPMPPFTAAGAELYAQHLSPGALVFDGRCLLRPEQFEAAGLRYAGIGYSTPVRAGAPTVVEV